MLNILQNKMQHTHHSFGYSTGICHVFCHNYSCFMFAHDGRTRLLGKANPGFPMSKGLGRLQVILSFPFLTLRLHFMFKLSIRTSFFFFFFFPSGNKEYWPWRIKRIGVQYLWHFLPWKMEGTDVAIKRINERCFAGKPSKQDRKVVHFKQLAFLFFCYSCIFLFVPWLKSFLLFYIVPVRRFLEWSN